MGGAISFIACYFQIIFTYNILINFKWLDKLEKDQINSEEVQESFLKKKLFYFYSFCKLGV